MAKKKETTISYKRTKSEVEITGETSDVKAMIWFDLITSKLPRLEFIILVFKMPLLLGMKGFELLKGKFPSLLILLLAQEVFLKMLLSG